MKYEIRYKPAFATVFISLEPGESIIAEAGAMVSRDAQLTMTTQLFGGLLAALAKKFFGGESLFVNVFRNQSDRPLELVLSQAVIGDIERIALNNSELYLQPGAFIAATPSVKIGVGWAGFASLIAGEGLFRLKVSGTGRVFMGAYGGISQREVRDEFIVDNSHLVAYEPSLKMNIRLSGGLLGSITSGEGLVNRLTGNGSIYLQSRSTDGLVRFLRPKVR